MCERTCLYLHSHYIELYQQSNENLLPVSINTRNPKLLSPNWSITDGGAGGVEGAAEQTMS